MKLSTRYTRWIGAFLLACGGYFTCSCAPSEQAATSNVTAETTATTRFRTSATLPLPPDVDSPPSSFYDPPLDLEGLVGRPGTEAAEWAKRQGFKTVQIVYPGDDVELPLDPWRMLIFVDEDGIVQRAFQ